MSALLRAIVCHVAGVGDHAGTHGAKVDGCRWCADPGSFFEDAARAVAEPPTSVLRIGPVETLLEVARLSARVAELEALKPVLCRNCDGKGAVDACSICGQPDCEEEDEAHAEADLIPEGTECPECDGVGAVLE